MHQTLTGASVHTKAGRGAAGLAAAFLLLAAAPAPQLPSRAELAGQAARRFPQTVRVGDLLRRPVLKPVESQDVIGHVQAVVRAPDGGASVVLRLGGVLGVGGRIVAVPVEAMVVVGQVVEVAGLTPAQLDGLPGYAGGDAPLPDDAVIAVGLAKPSH